MVSMDEILSKSKKNKLQADEIIGKSGILEILGSYGKVKVAGSYALDVMLRPDIDVYVVTDKHDWSKVREIHSKIIESNYFREVDFVNWLDFERNPIVDIWGPSIRGYYLRPIIPVEANLWKMDIWLITPEYDKSAERTDFYKKLLDQAGGSKKNIILEIKDSMMMNGRYIDGVDGKLIYSAVLERGIKTVDEFRIFLQGNIS